jgi:hypothetical protein
VSRLLPLLAIALALGGCRGGDPSSAASPRRPVPQAAPPVSVIRFADGTSRAGIVFVHRNGATGQKYMPETLGSGVCLFDYDSDGWIDVYFVQSGVLPVDPARAGRTGSVLYRNRGDGTFEDVTARAGLGGSGYGMGCTAADIENDGDPDLYVTAFGKNRLYRNNGDGTFTDVTDFAGVGKDTWSASAAFGDYDGDGLPDLYVTTYVDFTLDHNVYCGEKKPGYRSYCHPQNFRALPDVLYHNEGGGKFRDASAAARIDDVTGKGLGVVWGDFDNDGREDLYVANDSTPNFLYHNRGDGTFEEVGQRAGVALGENGLPRAGMGIGVADCDGNGRQDLFVTNLSEENNSLYRNVGDLLFNDESYPSGLGAVSLLFLGFGASFFDADGDGDSDLAVANGHILDNVELYSDTITFEQTPFFFEALGGCRFRDISAQAGDYFRRRDVGRGTAVGDLDNDGDPDLVISSNNRPAHLLWNESERASHRLSLRLVGRKGRDGLGARVEVTAGGARQMQEVRSASSYLSQGEMALHFGLGAQPAADRVRVLWPGGREQDYGRLQGDRFYVLREGEPAGEGILPGKPRR